MRWVRMMTDDYVTIPYTHSFCYSVLALLCLCRPFFERCLDLNPERCQSKQALYQLSHPSPSQSPNFMLSHPSPLVSNQSSYLATHLPY